MTGSTQQERNNDMLNALKGHAQATGDGGLLQRMNDLEQAMAPTDEPNLTGTELAKILGVPLDSEGMPVDMTTMFNACMNVLGNEKVQGLPTPERLRAIRTAADLLEHFYG